MAIDIIYRQKDELKRLYDKKYISRENINVGKQALKNDLIKVIIGPRRAGKSVYCLEILQNENFGYLNFDNEDVLSINSHEKIIDSLKIVYPEAKIFFLDEIQNLPKWELLVSTLQRRGFNIVLTGSNATLLSGELATHLTGRYQGITIYPFSFKEYLKAKSGDKNLILNYLQSGGYPEIVMSNGDISSYLASLIDSTIFKDIVKRYKVRYPTELENLVKLLFSGFSKQISLTNLGKNAGIGSHHTVNKYLDYLNQTYLALFLERFSFKTKERIKQAKKMYFVDTGFASTFFSFSPDFGKLMENAVFIHFLRQGKISGKDLFYFQTKSGKEVDFVVKNGIDFTNLVQVCWDISNLKTEKREFSALDEAEKELNCHQKTVITKDNLANFFLDSLSAGG